MLYLMQHTSGIFRILGQLQASFHSPDSKDLAIYFTKGRVSLVAFKENKHSHKGNW